MIIWIMTAIGGALVTATLALYFMWSNSGWLTDRRHALSKLDALVEELENFEDRFPNLGSRLHLSDMHEVWPQQRAKLEEQCSFVAWLKSGRPLETSLDRDSSALFQFARSQAGPLVWSMTQILEEPDTDLINRIKAVINRDTFELRFNQSMERRMVPARRLSDI